MFEELSEKLDKVFRNLTGKGKLTEKNIKDAMREIRIVLLESDVNYKIVKKFIKKVTEKAVGTEVLKSITPGQQVVKVVNDELVELMGSTDEDINLALKPPTIIMVVGLQGSGKTTACGKLALYMRKHKNKSAIMAACDIYRPAAVDQLEIVGKGLNIPVYRDDNEKDVSKIAAQAIKIAKEEHYDTVIIDTAGRLHIDADMMDEVEKLKKTANPDEILFVADGMTGQDAVNIAKEFNDRLEFNGVILTKMDSDAKGGAALSIREVTGKPIKFIGTGEKPDALEKFHPDRMASRILGMGDIVSLVEKAQFNIDEKKAQKLEEKMMKAEFTFEDFLDQLQQIKKMGPLENIIGMLPGANKMKGLKVDDNALVRIEAIISSMTLKERRKPVIINGSRRRRIAKGSGTTVQDVNNLLKQFREMKKMMKSLGKFGMKKFKFPF